MVNCKHASVIDSAGYYVDLVLVMEMDVPSEDGTTQKEWVVQNYQLQEGESLVEVKKPHKRIHADDEGLITYQWDGAQWVEGATPDEIAQWELEHPAPVVTPTATEQLRADIDFLALMGGVSL